MTDTTIIVTGETEPGLIGAGASSVGTVITPSSDMLVYPSLSADGGGWASTEATDTMSATGTKTHTGTMAPTEGTDTISGTGHYGSPQFVNAGADTVQP